MKGRMKVHLNNNKFLETFYNIKDIHDIYTSLKSINIVIILFIRVY